MTSSNPVAATLASWSSSTTPADLAALLKTASSAVVITHAKPDGDAIGSSTAIARSLAQAGLNVECWFVGPSPRWLGDLSRGLITREFAPGKPIDPPSGFEPGAIVIVDTGSWTQLAEYKGFIQPRGAKAVIIDHHLKGDLDVASRLLLNTAAASCTQVLAPLCTALLNLPSPAKLPKDIADALYLGLATDTGWFRFSNVTPSTLRLAADLIEADVDHTRLYRLIEQQDHAARWQLFGRALRTLTTHKSDRIATMILTLKDFADTGATPNDTSGFADMVLTIASVELSAVLVETEHPAGPLTKISLRSKPGPNAIDVNELASRLGGGGHARAAGAKIHQPPAGALAALVESVR